MSFTDTNSDTRQLCRFEPDLPPINMVAATEGSDDDYSYQISLQEFEKIMQGGLDDESDDDALRYVDRDDFGWLKCRRPLYALESVLGMEEEFEELNQDHTVKILVFASSRSPPPAPPHSSNANMADDLVPQYSWERTMIKTNDDSRNNRTTLEWFDLRSLGTDFELPTSASCTHFLRCLLDARHDASPWVPPLAEKSEATRDDKDVVVLLLDSAKSPEKLLNFRVSDACPSWFLHASGKLENVNSQHIPWVPAATVGEAKQDDALMLIYRRLPPRYSLSVKHPQSQQPVTTKGCLWESYIKLHPSGEREPKCQLVVQPFINVQKEYPGLVDPLLTQAAMEIMQNEAKLISHWTAWPERSHYSGGEGEDPWTVFPICHTFPAHDLEKKVWVPITCAFVPRTVELLKRHLGDHLRTALFSRLDPDSVLNAHTGWSDLANSVMRLHIPLILPSTGKLCGVWVDGCVQIQEPGIPVCFDDSKTHRAFNYSSESRIVLILDLMRPVGVPGGSATGGHTDELDQFIERMGMAR